MVPKGWITKALELTGVKVIDGDRGKEYPKASDFSGDGYCLFLSAKNVTKYGFQFNELQFIDAEKDKKLRKGRVKRSNIVLTTRGSVGHFAYYDASVPYDVMRINSGMVILDADESDLEPNFLYALCRSFIVQKQIEAASFGSAQPQLTVGIVKGLKLPIPTLVEQKKIAQILSTWDKAISVTEKLLANSQQQKKALMQQLLTGKKRLLDENGVRFSGEWEVVRLKQLIHEEKKRNRDNHIQRVLSVTNHSGFVLPEEQFSKRVASEDVSTYKIVKKNQYGYNPSRLNVGSFARLDNYDEGVLSPMYVVFSINHERLNSDYFLNWMSSNEAKQRIAGSTQGSVRDSVGFDALCSFSFSLPTLMEQQKIAAVLSAADAEMSMLEKKLACLKEEKKALMQQLLTGKRRVNVESEETVSA
ncbi:restriction endonuclease subunit S [Escherichia coli]